MGTCLGLRVQPHLRLPIILMLSQIPVDPCPVFAFFVSLEVEFDKVNTALMDEIGVDDAQRTVAQILAGLAGFDDQQGLGLREDADAPGGCWRDSRDHFSKQLKICGE